MAKSRKNHFAQTPADAKIKDFLDMVSPSVIQFNVDHYLCGNTYRCVWALREYPTATDEQAILRHLGEKDGITLRIYTRQVTSAEEKRIIHNAANKHRMSRSSTDDLQQTVTAESNLQDVVTLVSAMHRNREPLLHCAVYLELTAQSYDQLKLLQTEVLTELVRSKLNVDRLMLRQQQGFVSVMPSGHNAFGSQFERVLPASSVANLYPFNYSGKTDPQGFYIGKDKYGANVIVDFDKRDDDKTSANILILGNSGQGKSYLMKLLLLNLLEAGKSAISLDVEHEQKDMCEAVGGCFLDLMSGQYRINPLEPKCWDAGGSPEDMDAPAAFRQSTRLSQHISFLRDFFRSYKSFTDRQIDVIEIMVGRLYERWRISDSTDFSRLTPEDYPILSDLYALIEQEYRNFDEGKYQLYTAAILQEILLGLHSMCKGAESKFFNGHTNVTSSRFVVFGVKGLLQASKNVRSAMLFNVLSYLSDKLLTEGNTVAALDELYIWLSDNVAVGTTIIEYIRNCLKRVRKKESAMLLASQNLEDFNQEGIRELTKPLFAIPPHQFLFNAGAVDKKFYMEALQLEESEYNLIRFPQRGVCLYRCGNERYLLEVHAPAYKEALFGKAGGR
ncbi:type VI secretion protein [Eubacteriales bacterium]|nr:type VI secretion protein [Eubacteriales bacterium]GKH65217.1 type VI secretion protein [Eubacteriales bacterium]